MGLRVPEDVSIATFDNGIWTNHLKPSLTTTSENVDEIARVAMDMLFSRIEDNDRPPAQHLVPQEIIIRESTGPCPGI
jgi:DNA-binding LacI/PurR family transcriptional regulator